MRSSVGDMTKHCELVVHFAGHASGFIAQPEIDGQVRVPTPIVLNICSQEGLAKTTL